MLLLAPSLLLLLYLFMSLFYKTPFSLPVKIVVMTTLATIALKHMIYQFIGGSFFAPNLPRSLILTLEALYGSLVILFFMLLLKDIVLLGLFLYSRFITPLSFSFTTIKCVFLCLAPLLGFYGIYQSARVPDIHTLEIQLKKLPKAFDGFKIVQITDIHIGPILKKEWLEKVVQKANQLEPDLFALTGDYIDGHVNQIGDDLKPLSKLKSKYGVYGVTGNHEYYWDHHAWVPFLQKLNIDMLHNEHRLISKDGAQIVIAGMPDLVERKFQGEGPLIDKAFQDAPENTVRILLEHQPKEAKLHLNKADLQLSGHTHGGVMFFLKPLLAAFNAGFVQGLYTLENMLLYVSPGTGIWSGFSCRIGVQAEITQIILRSQ